jgi:tetratricopeptide (TPR) repeat protein
MLRFLIMHVRGLPRTAASGGPAVVSRVPSRDGLPTLLATEFADPMARGGAGNSARLAKRPADPSPVRTGLSAGRVVLSWFLCLLVLPGVGCACFGRQAHDADVVAARQLSLKGIDAQKCGMWSEAEGYFAAALQKNPADERAHCHFARVMWQCGRPDAAVHHLEESVRLSGGDPQLLVELGETYLRLGNVDAAWECASEALEANHRLASAWALRGDIFRCRQRWELALENYHRALSEQPHFPQVQLAAAAVYREQNRPRRALATLDVLESQLGPRGAPAELFYQQGLAYKALGRYHDAVAALTTASQQGSPSADMLYHLGEAHLLAGSAASAKLAAQAALELAPHHRPSLGLQAQIDRHNQSLTAAIQR